MYYQVIEEPSAENLTAVVSALIVEKGWIPQGGVAVTAQRQRWRTINVLRSGFDKG